MFIGAEYSEHLEGDCQLPALVLLLAVLEQQRASAAWPGQHAPALPLHAHDSTRQQQQQEQLQLSKDS
jgi:hypothetical protein